MSTMIWLRQSGQLATISRTQDFTSCCQLLRGQDTGCITQRPRQTNFMQFHATLFVTNTLIPLESSTGDGTKKS